MNGERCLMSCRRWNNTTTDGIATRTRSRREAGLSYSKHAEQYIKAIRKLQTNCYTLLHKHCHSSAELAMSVQQMQLRAPHLKPRLSQLRYGVCTHTTRHAGTP